MAFSFSLDGVRSEDKNIIVNEVKRRLLPTAVERKILVNPRIGDIFHKTDLRERIIEIDYTITGTTFNNVQDTVRDVADFLDPTLGLRELIFDDETDKKWSAVLDRSTPFDQVIKFGQGTMIFVIPSAVAESTTDVTENFSTLTFNFTRTGTAPSFPIITIDATDATSLSFVRVTLDETSEFIEANITATSGTVEFKFDHKNNEVLIDSVKTMSSLHLQSKFFTLIKGTNSFTITTDADTISGSVVYTPRFF